MASGSRKDITLVLTFDDRGSAQVKSVTQDLAVSLDTLGKKSIQTGQAFDRADEAIRQSAAGIEKIKLAIDNATKMDRLMRMGSDITGVTRTIAKMSLSLQDAGSRWQASGQKMAAAGRNISITMAMIVGGAILSTRRMIEFADSMHDLSQKTGVSTEVLSSFKLSAEKSGTSLNGVAFGLRNLSRTLLEAQKEGKAADKMFQGLGIATKDLTTGKIRPLAEVVYDLADKFQAMADGPEKATMAMKVFGRSGMEMIPMLNLGRAGLKENADMAQKLGQIISGETARAADEFNDKWAEVKGAMTGTYQTIVTMILPTLGRFAENVKNMALHVKAWMNENRPLVQALSNIGTKVILLLTIMGPGLILLGKWTSYFGSLAKSIAVGGAAFAAWNASALRMGTVLVEETGQMVRIEGITKSYGRALMETANTHKIFTAGIVVTAGVIVGKLIRGMMELLGVTKQVDAVFTKGFEEVFAGGTLSYAAKLREAAAQTENLRAATTKLQGIKTEVFAFATEKNKKDITSVRDEVKSLTQAIGLMGREFVTTGTTGNAMLDQMTRRWAVGRMAAYGLRTEGKSFQMLLREIQGTPYLTRLIAEFEALNPKIRQAKMTTEDFIQSLSDSATQMAESMGLLNVESVKQKMLDLENVIALAQRRGISWENIVKMMGSEAQSLVTKFGPMMKVWGLSSEILDKLAKDTKAAGEAAEYTAKAYGLMSLTEFNTDIAKMSSAIKDAQSQGLTWENSVAALSSEIISMGDKLQKVSDITGYQLPAAFKKAVDEAKLFAAGIANASLALVTLKDRAKNVWDSVAEMKKQIAGVGPAFATFQQQMTQGMIEDNAKFNSSANAIASKIEALRAQIKTKGFEPNLGPLNKALAESKAGYQALRESILSEIESYKTAYADRVASIQTFAANEKSRVAALISGKAVEIAVVAEAEKTKRQIEAASTAEQINQIRENGVSALGALKTSYDMQIDSAAAAAIREADEWKKGLDLRTTYLQDSLKEIDSLEKQTEKDMRAGLWNLANDGGSAADELASRWTTALGKIASLIGPLVDLFKSKAQDLRATIKDTMSAVEKAAINKRADKLEMTGELAGAAGIGLGGIAQAFAGQKKGEKSIGKAISAGLTPEITGAIGGALGGLISGKKSNYAGTGASIGGALGGLLGPLGGLIGSAAGGLLGGLFGKKEKKTEETRLSEQFDNQVKEATKSLSKYGKISETTAKAIAEDRKKMSGGAAEMKNFASVIKDVGVNQKNVNDLWKGATGIYDQFKAGGLDAATAAKSAGESFTELLKGAQELGTEGSKAMTDFLKQTKESGLKVKEVTDYINDQLGVVKAGTMNAAQGLEAMARKGLGNTQNINDISAAMKQLVAEGKQYTSEYSSLQKQLEKASDKSKTSLEALAKETPRLERQIVAVFNAMKANGATLPEIFDTLAPTLDLLSARYAATGATASSSIAELLRIRDVTTANRDLFDAISGNLGVLNALANTGSMTQETFTDNATAAGDYYNQLKAAGFSGNEALAQMAPTLERLRFLAREQGLALDDNTKSLIKQAEEQNLLKDEELSTNQTLMAGFGEIIKALGGDVPDAMQKAMDKMRHLGEEGTVAADALTGSMKISQEQMDALGLSADQVGNVIRSKIGEKGTEYLTTLGDTADTASAQMADLEKSIYGSGVGGALEKVAMIGTDAMGRLIRGGADARGAMSGLEGSLTSISKTMDDMDIGAGLSDKIRVVRAPDESNVIYGDEGGEWSVGKARQTFVAHSGETVKIGSGDNSRVEMLLAQLIEAVDKGMNVSLEPITIPSEKATTVKFVQERLARGDWDINANGIRGRA